MRYTQKQIDKYKRQKYMNELDKIAKNLFRMFRNKEIKSDIFVHKFEEMKKKFDEQEEVRLDSEYFHQLREYIIRLYQRTCEKTEFTDRDFDEMRGVEIHALNRLKKLQKSISYKKEKHKRKCNNEEWD